MEWTVFGGALMNVDVRVSWIAVVIFDTRLHRKLTTREPAQDLLSSTVVNDHPNPYQTHISY